MILIVLSLCLFYLNFRITQDRVHAGIYGATAWTLFVFVTNELLSIHCFLTRQNLIFAYGICCILLLAALTVIPERRTLSSSLLTHPFQKIRRWDFVSCMVFVLFAVSMLILAAETVPSNWDSMTYHLSRVFHWAQNRSIAHYATHITRQNSSPVLDEFVLLHLFLLSGKKDVFLNLLQCASFLANGILVYHIAAKLKLQRAWCLFAAVLFYTSPIVFMESVTTQNDHFAAFWALTFVLLLLDFYEAEHKLCFDKLTIEKVILLSLQIALGYLTKPNVCIIMAIFVLGLLLICCLRRDQFFVILRLLPFAAFPMLVLLLPEFARNRNTFHALSASEAGARQLIGTLNPRYMVINFLKDYTYNLPTRLLPGSSSFLYRAVRKLSILLNVDLNAPAIAEDGTAFFVPNTRQLNCDMAINPLVFWLVLLCIILVLIFYRKIRDRMEYPIRIYWWLAMTTLLLFCAILRWEPFITRYMIGFIGIVCPAIALTLHHCFPSKAVWLTGRILIYLICLNTFAALLSTTWCTVADSRMAPRYQGYFLFHPDLTESYLAWADYISEQNIETVGFLSGENDYEYPFTAMLPTLLRMEHVNVTNVTSVYEDTDFHPAVIVRIGDVGAESITCHGTDYRKVAETETLIGALYVPY